MPKAGFKSIVSITTVIVAILGSALAPFPFDVVIYFIRRLMRPEGHGIVVLSFWNVICRRHHLTSFIDGPLLIDASGCLQVFPENAFLFKRQHFLGTEHQCRTKPDH